MSRWRKAVELGRDIVTAGAFGASADAVCQYFEPRQHPVSTLETDSPRQGVDWRRCVAFSLFTGVYLGGACNCVYALYPRITQQLLRGKIANPRAEGWLATALDNFVHVPFLYVPAFYLSTGMLRGDDLDSSVSQLSNRWGATVFSCCAFWIPVQYLVFSRVTIAYRVRAVAAGDFVWNVILSYVANNQAPGLLQGSLTHVPTKVAKPLTATELIEPNMFCTKQSVPTKGPDPSLAQLSEPLLA